MFQNVPLPSKKLHFVIVVCAISPAGQTSRWGLPSQGSRTGCKRHFTCPPRYSKRYLEIWLLVPFPSPHQGSFSFSLMWITSCNHNYWYGITSEKSYLHSFSHQLPLESQHYTHSENCHLYLCIVHCYRYDHSVNIHRCLKANQKEKKTFWGILFYTQEEFFPISPSPRFLNLHGNCIHLKKDLFCFP